jgi:hypothetical protein
MIWEKRGQGVFRPCFPTLGFLGCQTPKTLFACHGIVSVPGRTRILNTSDTIGCPGTRAHQKPVLVDAQDLSTSVSLLMCCSKERLPSCALPAVRRGEVVNKWFSFWTPVAGELMLLPRAVYLRMRAERCESISVLTLTVP